MAENNKIIETYADDMAEVIEQEGGSLVKKIIQGEEKHEEEKKNLSPESKRNRIFIGVGLFLILLSVATLLYFFIWREKNKPIDVMEQFVPLIFHDQSIFIEVDGLNKDEIKQIVLNHVEATEVKGEGIEGIYLTENKKVVGLRRFLSMIESNFVPGDNLLLVQDGFLMGVFNNKELPAPTGKGFFILIKMRSISDIFNAMRIWEGKMLSDLHKFIGLEISKETNYLFTKDFDNTVVGNKNARSIYDLEGKLILMYIFADENSVIITDSIETGQEILRRLASKQREQ